MLKVIYIYKGECIWITRLFITISQSEMDHTNKLMLAPQMESYE